LDEPGEIAAEIDVEIAGKFLDRAINAELFKVGIAVVVAGQQRLGFQFWQPCRDIGPAALIGMIGVDKDEIERAVRNVLGRLQ
jgi:hypothetical protein